MYLCTTISSFTKSHFKNSHVFLQDFILTFSLFSTSGVLGLTTARPTVTYNCHHQTKWKPWLKDKSEYQEDTLNSFHTLLPEQENLYLNVNISLEPDGGIARHIAPRTCLGKFWMLVCSESFPWALVLYVNFAASIDKENHTFVRLIRVFYHCLCCAVFQTEKIILL